MMQSILDKKYGNSKTLNSAKQTEISTKFVDVYNFLNYTENRAFKIILKILVYFTTAYLEAGFLTFIVYSLIGFSFN